MPARSAEVAAEFVQFTKIYQSMVTIWQIVDDPLGCEVPRSSDIQWALTIHILDHVEPGILNELTHANRFPMQFRVFFFRVCCGNTPTCAGIRRR